MSSFKISQKTYFNDFLNENCDFENYYEDIIYQIFYIYHKNKKQFYNVNKKKFIKKKKRNSKNNKLMLNLYL